MCPVVASYTGAHIMLLLRSQYFERPSEPDRGNAREGNSYEGHRLFIQLKLIWYSGVWNRLAV